jgi:hypothetical protein
MGRKRKAVPVQHGEQVIHFDLDDFESFGVQIGAILRDVRDPSRDGLLQERLSALSDAIEAGDASMQTIGLFVGFIRGLNSAASDDPEMG